MDVLPLVRCLLMLLLGVGESASVGAFAAAERSAVDLIRFFFLDAVDINNLPLQAHAFSSPTAFRASRNRVLFVAVR